MVFLFVAFLAVYFGGQLTATPTSGPLFTFGSVLVEALLQSLHGSSSWRVSVKETRPCSRPSGSLLVIVKYALTLHPFRLAKILTLEEIALVWVDEEFKRTHKD
jgi:hypothetical protein